MAEVKRKCNSKLNSTVQRSKGWHMKLITENPRACQVSLGSRLPYAYLIMKSSFFAYYFHCILLLSFSLSLYPARRHHIRLGSGSTSSDAGGEAFECNRRLLLDWLRWLECTEPRLGWLRTGGKYQRDIKQIHIHTQSYTYSSRNYELKCAEKVWLMNCALSCWCATPTAMRVG